MGRKFPHPSRTALGPNQPPVQWAPVPCTGGKVTGRDVEHTTKSSAEVTELLVLYLCYISGPSLPVVNCTAVLKILGNCFSDYNPYPTAFPYGNGMVLHFYQQQESSTTKTVHKVINKGLKTYV